MRLLLPTVGADIFTRRCWSRPAGRTGTPYSSSSSSSSNSSSCNSSNCSFRQKHFPPTRKRWGTAVLLLLQASPLAGVLVMRWLNNVVLLVSGSRRLRNPKHSPPPPPANRTNSALWNGSTIWRRGCASSCRPPPPALSSPAVRTMRPRYRRRLGPTTITSIASSWRVPVPSRTLTRGLAAMPPLPPGPRTIKLNRWDGSLFVE